MTNPTNRNPYLLSALKRARVRLHIARGTATLRTVMRLEAEVRDLESLLNTTTVNLDTIIITSGTAKQPQQQHISREAQHA
jgi:hypothetical protein